MTAKPDFPQFDQLFGAYLNQDYELSGGSLEEVIQTYKDDSGPQAASELVAEIDRFKAAHPHDLHEALMARHGFDFDPQLWGHDMDSFFSLLVTLAKP